MNTLVRMTAPMCAYTCGNDPQKLRATQTNKSTGCLLLTWSYSLPLTCCITKRRQSNISSSRLVLGYSTTVDFMHMHSKTCTPCEQGLGVHGNTQARPCSSHAFSTDSKETAMQKPGDDAKDFGLSRQAVHR